MINGDTFLYPNVTQIPSRSPSIDSENLKQNRGDMGAPGEFDATLTQELKKPVGKDGLSGLSTGLDLNQLREPLKFSAHAAQRMQERRINLDAATMSRVNDAIDKAAAKGVDDTLVITGDAALIVSVKNRTVITAMDKTQLNGNVFTNIDGAVIV